MLTRAQRKCLEGLTNDWRQEERDWKASRVFLDLADRGLCEWGGRYIGHSTIRTGPGFHGAHRWFTRITADGRAAVTTAKGGE
jgi:hypothetical protein